MDKDTSTPNSNEPSPSPEVQPQPEPTTPTTTMPKPQDDDQLLASVSQNMTEDEPPEEPPATKPPRNKKKLLIILLVVLLLSGMAAGGYYWFTNQKSQEPQESAQVPAAAEITNAYLPNTVSYAFRDDQASGYSLFWRPADGGERTEVTTLNRDTNIMQSATRHNFVAFATETSIYRSNDSGASFEEIVNLAPGEQITSLNFSSNGDALVYGSLTDATNTVIVLQAGSDEPEDLFEAEEMGVFIHGYDTQQQKIIYSVGCYNCDGPSLATYSRDLSKNESTEILTDIDPRSVQHLSVSDDLSHVVLAQATIDESINTGDLPGYYLAAPYTVKLITLENNQEQVIATVGEKQEKNPNGTQRYRQFLVGFLVNSNEAYYAHEKQLFSYETGADSASLLFESTGNIFYLPYVSEETLIVGFGESPGDYTLVNFDVTTEESLDIFLGDNNTVLFGVTTK